MTIGVPKEIKTREARVALTPAGAESLIRAGHSVIIETNAGAGSGFSDEQYAAAGARLTESAESVFSSSDMIMKVKEPDESEIRYLREGMILFAYLHLAPDTRLTDALLEKGVTAIAYETIQVGSKLPLLAPMSEVAGRMSVQIGANLLFAHNGGSGMLLGGVPGVESGSVTVIGGGVVGAGAVKMAVGLGARVTVLDISTERLAYLDDIYSGRITTLMSNHKNIADATSQADLLIGAVLLPGAKAPTLVTDEMVKTMRPGSVIVDVAIDQGGCVETADRVTTHDSPTFVKHGVIHYCVANMPGGVPRTSTIALTNATLPYALNIANLGVQEAMRRDSSLLLGLNTYMGEVTCKAVSKAQNRHFRKPEL